MKSARTVIEACAQRGVEVLTLFAFSSENWRRPKSEVNALMELFITALRREIGTLAEQGIRMRFIGAREAFSERLQAAMAEAEARTSDNRAMTLVVAANYGGRWDIVQAAERAELTGGTPGSREHGLAENLTTSGLPDPDLFIRTGGERRLSNFLLWQLAYTELYFTDVLWPDFGVAELDLALADYGRRQRRFGRTGEQVEAHV
ncbi:di-trans,poly-cis-decaprenylcistransferase [Acidihalobacter prosperus]|uniref:Ditrans,polycis-undecaprenyl-diphosphate synthase ((2E,6E)-farnesyl-diphosphate specific) n=1 Tax=Acidihalobacter prosperus TaxID=160660 RepID=A0A1A6C901_9GAMM|nr:di-trans,poly-cis-decaprenylcistransferase [Acidihalobacter prosperus]